MGRRHRKKGGGKGHSGNGTEANDTPPHNSTPVQTPTPNIDDAVGRNTRCAAAEAEATITDPINTMTPAEPMQRTADALSPTDAVAAINAYAYQNAVDLIAPASVTTGPLNAKDEPVAKTTDASASAVVSPLASRKKVVFITSAATSSSLGEEKQPHEARCVESTCANCAVL